MITIRKFDNMDAIEVSNLIRKVLIEINSKDYPQSVIDFMCNECTSNKLIEISKKREFFVAVENDRILGTVTLEKNYIGSVLLHPEHQNKYISTKLMSVIENLAKKNNIKKITLQASITAIQFYKKLGYKEGRKTDSGPYGTTFKMTKKL